MTPEEKRLANKRVKDFVTTPTDVEQAKARLAVAFALGPEHLTGVMELADIRTLLDSHNRLTHEVERLRGIFNADR